jgi:hypothetical protein
MGMHRATNPFVAGKYVSKGKTQQYQYFRRQDKLSASFIFPELPLTKQAVWVL